VSGGDESAKALQHWDRAASAYAAGRAAGPLTLSALYEPVIDDLLGEVAGKRVLDAGCGDGTTRAGSPSAARS
jgi:hypothetical protein